MKAVYARDLDLNLLKVFLAVADTGSVTLAASALYLTQPAVSAALKRLRDAVGADLFARHGRGLMLTERGNRLAAEVRPHLQAITDAALAPPKFDPMTSDRTLRVGLADSAELWLLPELLRSLAARAPRMRLICLPVQFRTVGDALATRKIDFAITVADDLLPTIKRQALFFGGFVCLYDPRFAKIGKTLTERVYFAHEHVIVSYNGDLRGVVEDTFHKTRRVRCSIASFHAVGPIVDGSALLATIPEVVARPIVALRPHLRTIKLPFEFPASGMELLWPSALDGDDAFGFLRGELTRLATKANRAAARRQPRDARSSADDAQALK